MTKERVLALIAESIEVLKTEGMLGTGIPINNETILLGKESPFDSIGFVTFITELEDRISDETQKDLYLVLDEIDEFNINNPRLSVDRMAEYVVQLSEKDD